MTVFGWVLLAADELIKPLSIRVLEKVIIVRTAVIRRPRLDCERESDKWRIL